MKRQKPSGGRRDAAKERRDFLFSFFSVCFCGEAHFGKSNSLHSSALLRSAPLCVGCCCINNTLRADLRARKRKGEDEGGNNSRGKGWGRRRVREGAREKMERETVEDGGTQSIRAASDAQAEE